MSKKHIISNIILFQIGWFACVLGAAYQYPWIGTAIALSVIAIHIIKAGNRPAELRLVFVAVVIGVCFETLLMNSGLTQYSEGKVIENIAPVWMILMWPLFATTLNVSMKWMKPLNLSIAAISGAVLAPVAYYSGQQLGAVTFNNTYQSLLYIALGWSLLMPLVIITARKNNGFEKKNTKVKQMAEATHV